MARRAALVAREGSISVHETEAHAVLAAALAADGARHRVEAESLIGDAKLAQRKRVEAGGGNSVTLSIGRHDGAGPLRRRMMSTDNFELTRATMTPDGDNRDREPVDRAVAGDGMRQRLPPVATSTLRALPLR